MSHAHWLRALQGLPRNDDIGFGKVVTSPLEPSRTLAVVQPQEGSKYAADAFSRYEYELFSGRAGWGWFS